MAVLESTATTQGWAADSKGERSTSQALPETATRVRGAKHFQCTSQSMGSYLTTRIGLGDADYVLRTPYMGPLLCARSLLVKPQKLDGMTQDREWMGKSSSDIKFPSRGSAGLLVPSSTLNEPPKPILRRDNYEIVEQHPTPPRNMQYFLLICCTTVVGTRP